MELLLTSPLVRAAVVTAGPGKMIFVIRTFFFVWDTGYLPYLGMMDAIMGGGGGGHEVFGSLRSFVDKFLFCLDRNRTRPIVPVWWEAKAIGNHPPPL